MDDKTILADVLRQLLGLTTGYMSITQVLDENGGDPSPDRLKLTIDRSLEINQEEANVLVRYMSP